MFCKWLGEGTTTHGAIIEVLIPHFFLGSVGLHRLTARRLGKDTTASCFRLLLPNEMAQLTAGSV